MSNMIPETFINGCRRYWNPDQEVEQKYILINIVDLRYNLGFHR